MKAIKKFLFIGGGSKKHEVKDVGSQGNFLNFIRKISVLVVDDDIQYGQTIKEHLITEKMNVSYASTAEEAVHHLASQDFDCILLDFNLNDPEKNGDWVVAKIREDQSKLNFNTPVVLISGFIDHEHEVMNKNVQGMLEKPVSNTVLSSLIKQIVSKNT